MLQTCLIRGVTDGVPNGSHACERRWWWRRLQRLLAGQEGVPGLSGEQVTSGSQVDAVVGGSKVKAQRAEPQGSKVKGRGLSG